MIEKQAIKSQKKPHFMALSMSIVKDSVSIFTTRIISILIPLVGSIIVSRILGPLNRGALDLLMLVPFLFVAFGNLGIGNANVYYIGKKLYRAEVIISNSFAVSFISSPNNEVSLGLKSLPKRAYKIQCSCFAKLIIISSLRPLNPNCSI